MFCISVFDTVEQNRRRLKEAIAEYSIKSDIDIEIIWFSSNGAEQQVKKYANKFQSALISLDDAGAERIGSAIYSENPDCLICYYASVREDLSPLLPSRPIAFYLWKSGIETLTSIFNEMVQDWARLKGVFRLSTRNMQYSIPIRNILYFESDLKYVIIHHCDGQEERVFGKLSDVRRLLEQDNLEGAFLQIHKSYMVNVMYITMVDKSRKCVGLSNLMTLPISNAQYAKVVNRLSPRSENTV